MKGAHIKPQNDNFFLRINKSQENNEATHFTANAE
jgi:hypothetical protein